ncbi:MAG: hypothetical protein ABFD50_04700 [Smithella sp.]
MSDNPSSKIGALIRAAKFTAYTAGAVAEKFSMSEQRDVDRHDVWFATYNSNVAALALHDEIPYLAESTVRRYKEENAWLETCLKEAGRL